MALVSDEELIRGVSYVGLTVTDLEAAAKFYQGPARLQEVDRGRIEGTAAREALPTQPDGREVVVDWRLLQSTNAQVRLMQFAPQGDAAPTRSLPAVPVHGPGLAHLCYQADNSLQTYEGFLANGAEALGNPELVTLNPRNPVTYAYALDPDGVMFEVEHVDVGAVAAKKPAEGFHRIRHVSLATPDMERALSFYSALFGIPNPRRIGGTEGLSGEQFDQVSGLPGTRLLMAWFPVRNLELEIVQYLSHPTKTPAEPRSLLAPGYNMIVFDVTNIEAAKKRFEQAGGTPVTQAHALDGGEIFFGRDPDGNLLGFSLAPADSFFSSARFPTQ